MFLEVFPRCSLVFGVSLWLTDGIAALEVADEGLAQRRGGGVPDEFGRKLELEGLNICQNEWHIPKDRLMRLVRFALMLPFLTIALWGQGVQWKKDNFSGIAWARVRCDDPKLEGGSFFSMRYVHLDILGYIQPEPHYELQFEVTRQGWMFIPEGESLILKIDGGFAPLSGKGSIQNREVLSADSVIEIASYPITPEQLKMVSEGKEVQFRLLGEKDIITGTFTPKTLNGFKVFQTEAVAKINEYRVAHPADPAPGLASAPAKPEPLRAGISFLPGAQFLQVMLIAPGSPNGALFRKFIVAIEGERGTGLELQAKLNAAVARHQDGTLIKILVSEGPGMKEEEFGLGLFAAGK